MCPKDADRMANSVDPDQTAQEQSDLCLHYVQSCLYENLKGKEHKNTNEFCLNVFGKLHSLMQAA